MKSVQGIGVPTCRGRPRCPRSGRSNPGGSRRRRMTEISMRNKLESRAHLHMQVVQAIGWEDH